MQRETKYALISEENFFKNVLYKNLMPEFDVAMTKNSNSSLPDHKKVQRYYELLLKKKLISKNLMFSGFLNDWKMKNLK